MYFWKWNSLATRLKYSYIFSKKIILGKDQKQKCHAFWDEC